MRRAAEDIGVSHTVVSRHVANLEHWIGRKLVQTGPRGVRLTPEGETFLAAVGRSFDIIADAAAALRPSRNRGRLRLWCIPGLATRWLTPRLTEIEAVLSGADIELRASEAKPDFARDEADAYIGFSVLQNLEPGALKLVRPRMFPVASPAWLDRHGHPASVSDLARLPLIHEGNHQQWRNWFDAIGYREPLHLSGPKLSDASISFDAALAGQGVALVNGLLAMEQLEKGLLVEPFRTDVTLGTYYMVTSPLRAGNRHLLNFTKWLVANITEPQERPGRAGASS